MCAESCDDDRRYWTGRFTDPAEDQVQVVGTAAAVARVHCVQTLELVLEHPDLTLDQLAHLTLRLVRPPGVWRTGEIRFLDLGDHTVAIEHLRGHSPLGAALVALAQTWARSAQDLATVAAGIGGPPPTIRTR